MTIFLAVDLNKVSSTVSGLDHNSGNATNGFKASLCCESQTKGYVG